MALAIVCGSQPLVIADAMAAPKAAAAKTEAANIETEKAKVEIVEAYPLASIVVDVASGKVLSQDHATERRYPASTTKLMTAYLALKALRDEDVSLDTPVVMTRRAAAEPPQDGFRARLGDASRHGAADDAGEVGQRRRRSPSARRSAAGRWSVRRDDERPGSRKLGMKDTRFINPNGLPGDGQYSSAKDLGILGDRDPAASFPPSPIISASRRSRPARG